MATKHKSKSKGALIQTRVRKIIERLDQAHPDAKLDLDFTNPLELLIALILAAQARDALVNQVTPALFAKYRSAEDYAAAPLEELGEYVRKINFSREIGRASCRERV